MVWYGMVWYGIPYHIIPYHTIHTIPYHTTPYHTIPYHTIPYHTIPYHTIPNLSASYHTIQNFPSQLSCESARRDLSSTSVQQLNWIFATNQLAAEAQETNPMSRLPWKTNGQKEKNHPLYHLYWVLIVRLTALQSRHNKRIRRRFCMFCPSLACTLALFRTNSLLFKVFWPNIPKLFDNVTRQQLQMGLLSE